MPKLSVVINTLNEADTLGRAIKSIKWADEVIVCDMHSDDESVEIARKLGAKVVLHKRLLFVEPARNFAISKANNEWVLILDPDEEIPETLANKIQELIIEPGISNYIRLPRKNLIFGKWMKASMWWPDYNIRLFKKGEVTWSDKIHIPPSTKGEGLDLPSDGNLAIIHHHYTSVSQYIMRLDRYTTIQASNLKDEGYKFVWSDVIVRPLNEFLSRFFANRGFEDGLHGLALSLLQAFSFLVMYIKVWEIEKFTQQQIDLKEIKALRLKSGKEVDYWFKYGNLSKNSFKRFFQRVGNKLT